MSTQSAIINEHMKKHQTEIRTSRLNWEFPKQDEVEMTSRMLNPHRDFCNTKSANFIIKETYHWLCFKNYLTKWIISVLIKVLKQLKSEKGAGISHLQTTESCEVKLI